MIREVPKHQTNYLGVVVSRFEDNTEDSDESPRNYKIKFNILGLPPFQNEWPIAAPIGNSTRPVNENDLVMIWDICESTKGAHTFFYIPLWEDRFTGLKNYDNYIDITEKNYAQIKLPNATMTFDKSGSNQQNQDDTNDNTQGSIKIEAGGSEITIDCATGNITIKGKTGSQLSLDGAITQTSGFSVLPNCPYTGAPHCTNFVLFQ